MDEISIYTFRILHFMHSIKFELWDLILHMRGFWESQSRWEESIDLSDEKKGKLSRLAFFVFSFL